jgi:signal peptidase I
MDPTINVNDKLIGFRLAYLFKDPQRGDIVIFKYPDDESQIFIKRIIGVPGDKVEIVEGVLYLNDKPTYEQYIKEKMYGNYGPYEVPDDCYFVLGDNRNVSEDARFWQNTYVTRKQILAKAWFKYSPGFSSIN